MSLLNLQVWHFVLNLCWDMLRPLQSLHNSETVLWSLNSVWRLLWDCWDVLISRGDSVTISLHHETPWQSPWSAWSVQFFHVCLLQRSRSASQPKKKRPAAAKKQQFCVRWTWRPKLCKAQDHWPDITWKPREKRKKRRLHWYMYSHSYILV